MKRWIQPRILTNYLEKSLNNGHYRLTFREISSALFRKESQSCVEAIRHAWFQSQKQLRRQGTCAILVTEIYFVNYTSREPKGADAIRLCIAGVLGGKAYGVRLLTMKGVKDDPMALMYFNLRGRNVRGTVAAIEDRAVVEWTKGKLSKRVAKRIIDKVSEPVLPDHQLEFAKLMDIKP